ncbi:ABC transporter ATP-binding protein [Dongia sp.]|uniref:ABC transporter ATP-binding protein n=1 Tax=Dongia sp. TaxID=1977262 RepID=UPI0035B4E941
MAQTIEFRNVTKQYFAGGVAVADLSMKIEAGSIVALVGPSGCGKTTSLKMINRLIEPTSGEILLEGQSISRLPLLELRRSLGYVIQYVGLFPHMSVADNIAVVPRLLGWPQRRIDARVDELLELVGLPPAEYRSRKPRALSGGQQQRIGVARALAADPPVLLMDEPFGALDPITRIRLQAELKDIQRKLNKTIVIVTHDIEEAVYLGDRIAVLRGGALIQYDRPQDLLAEPADDFVASLLGSDRHLKLLRTLVVRDVLTPTGTAIDGPSIAPASTLTDALMTMLEAGKAAVNVIDAGRVVGHISANDIASVRHHMPTPASSLR